jgi:hypothetical protein
MTTSIVLFLPNGILKKFDVVKNVHTYNGDSL